MEEALWKAAVLRLPRELEDAFIGRLAGHTTGVISTPTEDGNILLNLFLRPDGIAQALEEAGRFLAESGLCGGGCGLHVESIQDGHWVERYQASLEPFPLGERFTVYPRGGQSGVSSRIPLLLLPGRAFGTGEHPTTRLCVEWLESMVLPGERWLDLGCGTAVLAIVAHHCGAKEILAIDNDPDAIEVAASVLRANGLAGRIALECRSIREQAEERWDGIVANISSPFLVEQAAALSAALKPEGRLLCSGFLVEDLAEVGGALAGSGLEIAGRSTSDGWVVMVAMKAAGSPR
jgi:ribosomal protein L11 methyltransferase